MSHHTIYLYSIFLFMLFSSLTCKKNTNKVDASIEKSIEYIQGREEKFEASTGLFIRFLAQKFEWANIPSLKDMYGPVDVFSQHPSTKLYQRLARPHSILKKDIEQYEASSPINDLQYVMLAGMYCDQIPQTDDFLQKIKTQTELDGYFLTHAVLALHFTQCLKCPLSDEFQPIKKRQTQLLKKLIETTDIQDLKYEAIAILKLIHPDTGIKQEWITEVIDNQLEDGGWARINQLDSSNDHTTFLALWVLLESKYSDVMPVCIVQ